MTEYDPNKELSDAVEDMLGDAEYPEFNPIREQELQIYSLMCVREDAKGEPVKCKGAPIVCRKIPAIYQALTKGGHYVVVADNNFWTHANEIQQQAALHHALMSIQVEVTDKGGIKLQTRKPDVMEHSATVAHFGAWNEDLLCLRDALKQSAKQFAEKVNPTA